jgi:PAS domain S-box-containing protein
VIKITNKNKRTRSPKQRLPATKKKSTELKEDLQHQNFDLLLANNDLANVILSVDVSMVVLDKKLRIRFLTPRAEEILNLVPSDVGRTIAELESASVLTGLKTMISGVITTMKTMEQNVVDSRGVWHSLRVRPYKTSADTAEGAVLTLVNIDDMKGQALASRVYAEMIAETVRESILVLDEELRVLTANRAFLETFKVSHEEIENRPLHELGDGEWNIPLLLRSLAEILPKKNELRNFEVAHNFQRIGQRNMVLNARQVRREQGSRQSILLAIDDVTEQKQAIDGLRKQSELLHLAHDAIISRDVNSVILFWNRGAEETYGWSAAEACGNVSHDFLRTEFSEPFDQMHEKLFSAGSWEGELIHWTREGRRITVASRQVVQRDQQGRAIGILEINRDVTLRKEAEESLRNLSARLLQLQDEERRRIARELHDSTGQSLAALVIHLSAVSARVAEIDPAAADLLREAVMLSQKASDETRTLSYLLYPPTLDHSGLGSALEWYIDGFTERSKVKVELKVSLGPKRLAEIVERTIFRIVQESLTNIFRHSGSETASVRVALHSGIVQLEVGDDGKGIPVDILAKLNSSGGQLGVGIRGMRERVRQLGGWLQIRSRQGGTIIAVSLPIQESAGVEGRGHASGSS